MAQTHSFPPEPTPASSLQFSIFVQAAAWRMSWPSLEPRWEKHWAMVRLLLESENSGDFLPRETQAYPWRGSPPTDALRSKDPACLSSSVASCARDIILAPALGRTPDWSAALLSAAALLLPRLEDAPPSWRVSDRIARMCAQLPSRGQPLAAHKPAAMLSADVGGAVLCSASPEGFLSFFLRELGDLFWEPATIVGFGQPFAASFAERVAARVAAEFLLQPTSARARALHLSNAAMAWKWIFAHGSPSVESCADSLADAAALVDWAWLSPARSGAPRAWRQACEGLMNPEQMAAFAARLRWRGAEAAAKALDPTTEQALREELFVAIPPAKGVLGSAEQTHVRRL